MENELGFIKLMELVIVNKLFNSLFFLFKKVLIFCKKRLYCLYSYEIYFIICYVFYILINLKNA